MKRKPSASRLAKGLERMAHEAERKASALRVLGLERWANGVASAARELSAAAEKAAEKAAR
jgi:hypothetical protein